ncbi:ABC transporter ATP-binding protein [Pseudochrobactrum asaccharolyticum]|uniref:ATP-binding cassette subfamily B protein n=1 Tax=Pseudochrobactrum asaccharolyticum TaxID=354351 RepID=A0A366DXR3_9HYPH|nr:ABC transporter ATP-binding protein [Pseudochrobactrum asaccharolyticum]RBO94837.1 ATP-binding cassette subfamily B protein [Pseudochrobactrum asaccharolyticum]
MPGKSLSSMDKNLIYRLLKDNFSKHARLYVVAIIAMLIVAATTAMSAWIMRDIVNEMVVSRDIQQVMQIAIAVAVIFTVKGFATFFQGMFLSRAGNSIIAEQQRKIYNRLLQQGVSFYNNMPSSDILVRVTHNAQAARAVIDTVVTSFVRDMFTLLGLVAVMFYQQPLLSLISFIFGPLAIFGVRILMKKVRKIMEQELSSLTKIVEIVQETTVGIRIIKTFSLEHIMRKEMDSAVKAVEKRANSIAVLESATSPIMETLAGLAIAGAIALSAIWVLEKGNTPGEMMSFITALLLAYEPAKRLARMRVSIEAGMIGVRMMYELIDKPITLTEAENAIELPKGKGEICFNNVRFSYLENQPILHDINLQFPAGKMTALVGASGSGKSTIINLIMHMYDPDHGSVEIDGTDIKYVTLSSLREKLAYVGQDTFLFSNTIMYNIGLGHPDATEEDIQAAAKAANAHDFIMKMQDGYHTQVGDNGNKLSGGQKQRIAIARAMLRHSEVLILDEATSALDSESEASIKEALQRLTEGKTTIVIAHRLTTITSADKIIVMEDGKVAEEGTQRELLASEGIYSRLYNYQFNTAE